MDICTNCNGKQHNTVYKGGGGGYEKLEELIYKYTKEDQAEQMVEAGTILRELKELLKSFDNKET